MTTLTHAQARQFILASADGLLASPDQEWLLEHLQTCSECRGYQAELSILEAQIRAACQEHRETIPSLHRTLVPNLQTQHRRNAMNARLASTLKFAIGSVLFAGLVILVVTSLLNAKKIQGTPTPQPAQQTPVLQPELTPTLETTILPEIDLGTGQQNGEWIAVLTSIEQAQTAPDRLDVYLLHPDGSSLKNVTNSPAEYSNLQWSPDGKNLAFLHKRAERYDLICFNPQDNSLKTLASFQNPSGQPEKLFRWSPDGKKIAFINNPAGNYNIFTINSDGSNLSQLTQEPGQETGFVWSPDGSQIAYESVEDISSFDKLLIYVIDARGGDSLELAHGMGFADLTWAQDGKSLYAATSFDKSWLDCELCFSNSAIYQLGLDGKTARQIFHANDSGGEAGISPDISGLYEVSPGMINFKQIVLTNDHAFWTQIDGKNTKTIGILDAPQVCLSNPEGSSEEYISPNPTFSLVIVPCAGKLELYLANRQTASPEKFLTRLDAQPGNIKDLPVNLPGPAITWSPDGQQALIQAQGASSDLTDIQLLDVGSALQGAAAQPGSVLSSKSPIFGMNWQPAPIEKAQTTTPANRLAAFDSTQDGNSEIFITRTDGGGTVNLSNNAAYDGNPIWSPDGMRLAFESERDGNREIYVMNLDGSGVTRLTNNPANDVLTTDQAWSPDGKYLLYRNDRQGKWDLFAARTDGSSVTQLTQDSDPAADDLFYWSPDGQKVAYEVGWTGKNKPQVYIINPDGTHRQQLPTPQVAFGFNLYNWSADGQALYYNASDCAPNGYGDCSGPRASLYRVALDGSEPVLLASAPEVLNWIISAKGILYFDADMPPMPTSRIGYDHWIWWKTENGAPKKLNDWPDLQEKCQNKDIDSFQVARNNYAEWPETEKHKLVAVYCGKDNQSWFYLVNADGSHIQLLNSIAMPGHADNLFISVDKRLALFDIFDASDKATYSLDLVAAQNDPTLKPIRLTGGGLRLQPVPFDGLPGPVPAPTPIASPAAQSPLPGIQQDLIAFVRNHDLFLMQKDGKAVRQLTKGQLSDVYNPRWSPNGKQITFWGEDKNNNFGQYLINLDGSGLTRLTAGGWNTIWSPDGSQLAIVFGDFQNPTESKIEIVNADGSPQRTIQIENIIGEPDLGSPMIQWSSDGKYIQFLAAKFSGGIPYSPSDQWTVYQANVQDGSLEILVESKVPIASWYGTDADLTYVTADQGKNVWQWIHNGAILATWNQDIFDPYFHCQWSPDHRQLVCTMRENDAKESLQLLLINANDFSIKPITRDLTFNAYMIEPSWSPDGRYLVFHSSLESAANNDIYRLDVQAALNNPATRPVRLTTSGFDEILPAWQPQP